MDFANRGNRPTQAPQQPASSQQQEQPSQSFQPMNNEKKKKGKLDFGKLTSGLLLIGTAFLVLALVLALVFGVGTNDTRESEAIQTDKYQAVFLNSQDGQVYFGKLAIYNRDLYQLTDIYYVRVENPIQPEGANQAAQPNISLAKLGNELHGPQDTMLIARDKVLYWENLKDDGQVVTAISEYKKNGEATPSTQQQTPASESTAPAGSDAPADTTPTDTTPAETTTP